MQQYNNDANGILRNAACRLYQGVIYSQDVHTINVHI